VGTFLASYFYQPPTRQVAQMPTTILTVSLLQSAIHAFVTVFFAPLVWLRGAFAAWPSLDL
jgi:hypothetical protein